MNFILIFCLPIFILCDHIDWQPRYTLRSKRLSGITLLTSSDGSVHIFSKKRLATYRYVIQHQRFHPSNRTITALKDISETLPEKWIYNRFDKSQVSISGNHIVLAYVTERSTVHDVRVTESFDGGNTWSKPVYVVGDTNFNDRIYPLVALEDTGRVYVAYYEAWSRRLVVREPGDKAFSQNVLIYTTRGQYEGSLGVSHDKESSVRYLHFIWHRNPRSDFDNGAFHVRSSDGGKTWTKPAAVALLPKGQKFSTAAVGINGGIFAQIITESSLDFKWSEDHGETWNKTLRLHRGSSHDNEFSLCETSLVKRLFSFSTRSFDQKAYLDFWKTGEQEFKSLEFPFAEVERRTMPYMACGIDGEGKQSVVLVQTNQFPRPDYLAYGVLKTD